MSAHIDAVRPDTLKGLHPVTLPEVNISEETRRALQAVEANQREAWRRRHEILCD